MKNLIFYLLSMCVTYTAHAQEGQQSSLKIKDIFYNDTTKNVTVIYNYLDEKYKDYGEREIIRHHSPKEIWKYLLKPLDFKKKEYARLKGYCIPIQDRRIDPEGFGEPYWCD